MSCSRIRRLIFLWFTIQPQSRSAACIHRQPDRAFSRGATHRHEVVRAPAILPRHRRTRLSILYGIRLCPDLPMEHERTTALLALGRAVGTPSGKVDSEVKRPMQHKASS